MKKDLTKLQIYKSKQPSLPADLKKALSVSTKAKALWLDITPIARRDWILWITSAKLPETRVRRINKTCSMLSAGKRRVCCFGGIKWFTKMNEVKNKASNRN